MENEIKEVKRKYDESEYELERTCDKALKLDRQLADTLIKLSNMQKLVPVAEEDSSSASNNNHVEQNGKIMYHKNLNQNSKDSTMAKSNLTDKQVK